MNVSEELTALGSSIDAYDEHIVTMSTNLANLKAQRMALVARQRHLNGLVAAAVDVVDVDGGQPDDIDVWEQDQYNSDVELLYRTDLS